MNYTDNRDFRENYETRASRDESVHVFPKVRRDSARAFRGP
jgi:hypothetical protein